MPRIAHALQQLLRTPHHAPHPAKNTLHQHTSSRGCNTPLSPNHVMPLPNLRLTPSQSHTLAEQLGPHAVRIIPQHAGQRVYVPAGWVHCVYNMRPCVKIAWDKLEAGNLVRYVGTQQYIVSLYSRATNPDDYIAVGALLMQHASLFVWRMGVDAGVLDGGDGKVVNTHMGTNTPGVKTQKECQGAAVEKKMRKGEGGGHIAPRTKP